MGWISFSPKLCLFHVLRQQICEPQTMASFCRQWSARGMSQEGRAWGGTISFHKPAAAEWVMPGGSRCHQDSNSKAPFTGPAAPEKGGEGPLEEQADGEKAASSRYLLPRLWGLRGLQPAAAPALQTLFNEKTNSHPQIRRRPAVPCAAPPPEPSRGLHQPLSSKERAYSSP